MRERDSKEGGRSAAAEYWDGVADPQNLERAPGEALSLEDELRFADAPDLRAAAKWLEGAPTGITLDLGAGLGANAFALARRAHRVVAADSSLDRLRRLRARAMRLGLGAERVAAVVATAEALPFRDGSLPRIYTKSVLIHTNLPRACGELARTLAADGRAALVEPQPGNPFAWFYRRYFAPKAWAAITRYFDPAAQGEVLRRFDAGAVRPFYFFSFLAFVFQFAWPRPSLFFFAIAPLHAIDRALFALVPPLRRLAWFGLIAIEKKRP